MAETPLTVLGLSGSLRHGSFNTAALRAAIELAPEGMAIETVGIGDLPPYNDDVRQAGFPPVVAELRRRIKAADALLIATPEYNYSVPGVLKNAIDWASRPPDQPFAGKPVAVMGASGGLGGTVRAQAHLRQSFVFLDMHPINKPEVTIRSAAAKMDEAGNLVDPETRDFIRQLLVALAAWTRRLKQA